MPRRMFGHAGGHFGAWAHAWAHAWAPDRTFGHMGRHFSARADILAAGRVFVQAGGYFVQNDSKMSKIRLIILYSESYTNIGHFCPKPFGLF